MIEKKSITWLMIHTSQLSETLYKKGFHVPMEKKSSIVRSQRVNLCLVNIPSTHFWPTEAMPGNKETVIADRTKVVTSFNLIEQKKCQDKENIHVFF